MAPREGDCKPYAGVKAVVQKMVMSRRMSQGRDVEIRTGLDGRALLAGMFKTLFSTSDEDSTIPFMDAAVRSRASWKCSTVTHLRFGVGVRHAGPDGTWTSSCFISHVSRIPAVA